MKPLNRGFSSKDWRAKRAIVVPSRFSNLFDITNTATMMKRE
jgi:hypothetical protein